MFNIENRQLDIGLSREYRLLQITDTHFTLFGENETKVRAEYATPRIGLFSQFGAVKYSHEWCMEYVKYANENNIDCVLFTGDIIDFPSPENIAMLREVTNALRVPYIFVTGNHDWSYFDNWHTADSRANELPLLNEFSGGNTSFHKIKVGELTVCALDNSDDVFNEDEFAPLEETLRSEENVLIIQHVPFSCPEMVADTVRVWGRNLGLGAEGTVRNGSADRMRKMICSYPSSKAVITGHLHEVVRCDLLEGKVPQFITHISNNACCTLFTLR